MLSSTSVVVTKSELLHLYKRLLRACEKYPSKNRNRIYQSIREEFRENVSLTGETARQRQIQVAYKGLSQLHQYDDRYSSNFTVQLEQNPFPKPDSYTDTRTERVEQQIRKLQQDEADSEKGRN
ncbi:complex 1 LYR family protein [Nitzschia inconspicua]|uniref:Complex 1 LYR family protein n=1 Tax=Nitzschia inconspicua TaxID=303405 RepID=A0A9K3K8Y4_9STRA|nr:complex 1 LYR family protein [Nitzschia inconspicua]KAG7350023.1 complex 1 LYR family protein [Nitzschia inconspicua]